MDLSDIQYVIELLESAIHNQDWDLVNDALSLMRDCEKELTGDEEENEEE